jgi:hypothetical protein
MMITEKYLDWGRLFRRLKNGPNGELVEFYAARPVKDGLARQRTWRYLNLVSDLTRWIASGRSDLADLDDGVESREPEMRHPTHPMDHG